MYVPPPDSFRQESGEEAGPPWWAAVPGGDFDLYVPDRGWEPDPESLAFAEGVLPELDAMVAEAAAYLERTVDFSRAGIVGAPRLISVHCDGRTRKVTLDVNWESDLYRLWSVTFHLHEQIRRYPVRMAAGAWGKS